MRNTSSARLRAIDESAGSTSVTPWSEYLGDSSPTNLIETADADGELAHRAKNPFEIIDADAVGDIVLDGIDCNQPYILTHPPHVDLITQRAEALLAAGPG
jgi:hypothetical protein